MNFPTKEKRFRGVSALVIALGALLAALPAAGQASFVENFDSNGPVNPGQFGPANLISRGWTFRMQSSPPSAQAFFDGFSNVFPPQAGAGYLAANVAMTSAGPFSNWAILPVIPNQVAGDAVTFWLRSAGGPLQRAIELRYSPSGGISTGSGPADVGDFTGLLLSVNPIPTGGWQQFAATLPGGGRIALRHVGQFAPFSFDVYTGIDTLSVGAAPPPPCNLPPIPAAGQSVIWSAAGSPYEICTDALIPAGGTAIVEPGVEVRVQSNHSLAISGTLVAQGNGANRVRFTAPAVFPPAIVVAGGTLDLRFTDVRGQLRPGPGGTILLSDCTFTGNGLIFSSGFAFADRGFVRIERCAFTDTQVTVADSWVVLRDSTFANTSNNFLRDYMLVEGGVTVDGKPLSINREENIQPLYVDGVTASNVATGGGLNLEGGNYLLGPSNALQNNLYPVDIRGGLLPGSVVPLTGNTRNMILAHEGGSLGFMYWANLGLPYLVNGFINGGGSLTIEPGVTVKFEPSPSTLAGLTVASTRRLIADGLPDARITFEALDPGNPWDGVVFHTNDTEGARLEYSDFRGAKVGAGVNDSLLEVQNSSFENNQRALFSALFGTAKLSNTRLFNNGIGLQIRGPVVSGGNADLFAPNMPNWFQGNGSAVENRREAYRFNATLNYWGHPTGPQYLLNPNGQGDPITGLSASLVGAIPFLTAPPDTAGNPPVVRMVEPGIQWWTVFIPPDYTLEPGTKFILRWELVGDTSGVVEQKALLSPEGGPYFDSGSRVPPIILADHLPPSQRSLEITMPDVGFAPTNLPHFLRIVAVDSAGREGWDQTPLVVPSGRISGNIRITSDYSGRTFTAGDPMPAITWQGGASGGEVTPFIFLETDGLLRGAASGRLPFVSTDAARQAVRVKSNSNDVKWFFSDHYFSIRLDPRLGLMPPTVQLLTPEASASFPSGSVVPITWTADAQQGLYSFDLQASTDGGLTWHPIVLNLPGTARSYDWELPPSGGISDVRVRVIARDTRFQNSSDGAGRVFSIVP